MSALIRIAVRPIAATQFRSTPRADMADNAANWNSFLDHAALTDVGLRRANNQDCHAIVRASDEQNWRTRGDLFMVADGMGAHAAGELASKLACDRIGHAYFKLADRPPPEALRQAFTEANTFIHSRGQANAEFQGMGTTSSVLVLLPEGALVGHVGDSRVYRLRGDRLEQLTFDHSLVWEMMAAGQIPRSDVPSFVPKNIITRSLGPHPEVQIDLEGPLPLATGDTFLLCSDGLTGQVKDEELGTVLGLLPPQEAVKVLVDLANLRGGPDNITVIVVRVSALPREMQVHAPSPLTAAHHSSSAVGPAPWVVTGACSLAAIVLALVGQFVPALICATAAAVGASIGFSRLAKTSAPLPLAAVGPLGRGPYSTRQCLASGESVSNLSHTAQQLRQAAIDEQWTIDWKRVDEHFQRAQSAYSVKNFSSAETEYLLAISFLMSEIRHQREKKAQPDSSTVDL